MSGTAAATKRIAAENDKNISPGTSEALSARIEESLAIPTPDHNAIETRAYQLWQERGSPIGSPEEDWLRAEQEMTVAQPGPVS